MAPAAKLTVRDATDASGEPGAAVGGPPAALRSVTWHPSRELEFVHWVRQGRWLGAVGRGCGWWIGDWIRYGNARYGEKYEAAARITGYDVHSLMNMAYVASRVDPSRRREHLSFSHHAELAALPSDEQELWLNRIESEQLSVRALRRALRAPDGERAGLPGRLRALPVGAEPARAPQTHGHPKVCPNCGHRFESDDGGNSC